MDDTASVSDGGPGFPRLPDFWLIITLHPDCVELFFHCRGGKDQEGISDVERNLVNQTVKGIEAICSKINKVLNFMVFVSLTSFIYTISN